MMHRQVLRQEPDGSFVEIKFADLKKGDHFRLIGEENDIEDGKDLYLADTDAYPVDQAKLISGEVLMLAEAGANFAVDVHESEEYIGA